MINSGPKQPRIMDLDNQQETHNEDPIVINKAGNLSGFKPGIQILGLLVRRRFRTTR